MNLLRYAMFFSLFFGLASCTSITVQGSAGIKQSYWFAPVQLSVDRTENVALVSSEGIGLVPSINGVVLGYSKEILYIVNDANQCRAIIILSDQKAIDSFTIFLKESNISLNNICISNSGEKI